MKRLLTVPIMKLAWLKPMTHAHGGIARGAANEVHAKELHIGHGPE